MSSLVADEAQCGDDNTKSDEAAGVASDTRLYTSSKYASGVPYYQKNRAICSSALAVWYNATHYATLWSQ